MDIHSTAIIDKNAVISPDIKIGEYCYVGPNVKIGSGCRLERYCNIEGNTEIGKNNIFYPHVSIGTHPQDYSYNNNIKSFLRIGDNNIFREYVTANVGSKDKSYTIIGNKNMFMINSHIGHNVEIENNIIIANNALLGGYVKVHNGAFISGNCCVHQFCSVGSMAMISGGVAISLDLPPFLISAGRNTVDGINLVAMKRNNVKPEAVKAVKLLYKMFIGSDINTSTAVIKARNELAPLPEVNEFLNFVKNTKRGIIRHKNFARSNSNTKQTISPMAYRMPSNDTLSPGNCVYLKNEVLSSKGCR
ncbi:MAG: acyl-ACP--UDP-N-acetylglucosamine O-acyltransferase [bacterium]|nr:acyl-ACP--UDP-N-acetylglucosamine O-acyltransferase [bacterium]